MKRNFLSKTSRNAWTLAAVLFVVLNFSGPAFAQAVRPGFTNGGSLPHDLDIFDGPIAIGFPVNFFGNTFTELFVGDHGYVTFEFGYTEFVPEGLRNNPNKIIAAFFADSDTRPPESGVVTYGRGTVDGRNAFAANWINVGYYSLHVDKTNSFQIVLIDRRDTGVGNFDIEFNYDRIAWEAGDEFQDGVGGLCAGRPNCIAPSVGYSNGLEGAANVSFEYPGSRTPGSFLDSNTATGLRYQTAGGSGVPGRLIFPVRNGVVVTGPTVSSLNPNTAPAQSPVLTMTINGSGFADGASVSWSFGGQTTTLPSQVQSATALQVTIPANLLTTAGTAQISVTNRTGPASNTLPFTITAVAPPAPTISSLSPSTAPAQSPVLTMTINGSGFAAGASVGWSFGGQTTTLQSQVQSATSLQVTIPANLLTTPGTAQVSVTNTAGPASNSLPFTITVVAPPPTLTSISPNSAAALSSALLLQVNGNNFVNGAAVIWTYNGQTTTLQTQFQSAALLQATVPASLLTSPGTAQVAVANPTATSNSLPFTVDSRVSINLTGLSPTGAPSQATNVGVSLDAPALVQLEGTLTLSFTANAAGVPSGYRDPATQFAAGGTTVNFTIPAGSTSAVLAQGGAIQQGTVAGTITVAVTRLLLGTTSVLPSPAPSRTVTVAPLAPVIVPNTVRITGRSATGFNVELDAYSTPRDLSSATFTFQSAPGAQLNGTSFSVSLSSIAPAWFSSASGQQSGGSFHLIVPFTYTGDAEALGSVSVTLTNSTGNSSTQTGS